MATTAVPNAAVSGQTRSLSHGRGNAVHRIDPAKLAYEAGRRGHDLSDLALGPDRVGLETLARIRQGGTVRLGTVRRIARKLMSWPVVPDLDAVLAAPEGRE